MTSPYRAALGGLVDELHPRLRTYFDEIPPGRVGRGSGVFTTAGARVIALRPFLALLERDGVATGHAARDVPFEVENRPGRGAAVHARRSFLFPGSAWTMVDTIAAVGPRRMLVDDLGTTRRIRAVFAASVEHGALVLRSTRVGVRIGPLRIAVPRAVAPVITLEERFDDDRGEQHVDVDIRLPVLGSVYGYAGWFRYRIEEDS